MIYRMIVQKETTMFPRCQVLVSLGNNPKTYKYKAVGKSNPMYKFGINFVMWKVVIGKHCKASTIQSNGQEQLNSTIYVDVQQPFIEHSTY